jgi:curved DNA-binding protein CbpA
MAGRTKMWVGGALLWQTVLVAGDSLYDMLGVSRHASSEEIRSAYRKLSKVYHPDLGGTAAFFRQLQEAYETLTDPFRRALYDRSLWASDDQPPRRQPAPGFGPPVRRSASPQQSNFIRAPRAADLRSDRDHAVDTRYRRLRAWWPQGGGHLPAVLERHHQEILVATWITSVIAVGVVIGTLLEVTHGLVLILLVILALAFWRKYESIKRKADQRERAAHAAAEFSRSAREAALRHRQAHAATAANNHASTTKERDASEPFPSQAPEPDAAEAREQKRRAGAAARSGDLEVISKQSPLQFEYTMVALLSMLGMTDVHRAGGRAHLAIDLTARDAAGRTVLARCKRYPRTEKTGSPDVQEFVGVAATHQRAAVKLLVTTSDYTAEARELAARHNMQLIDGAGIEQLAQRWRRSRSHR